jgi:uncharacterized protein YoxC
MSGRIIALIIALLALVVLIAFGLIVWKKVSHLMKEIDATTIHVQDKIIFFTKDTDAIKFKIDLLTQRMNGMSAEVKGKMKNIDYFSETTTDFQIALDELKQSIERLFTGFFGSSSKKSTSQKSSISVLKRTAEKFIKKQNMA